MSSPYQLYTPNQTLTRNSNNLGISSSGLLLKNRDNLTNNYSNTVSSPYRRNMTKTVEKTNIGIKLSKTDLFMKEFLKEVK